MTNCGQKKNLDWNKKHQTDQVPNIRFVKLFAKLRQLKFREKQKAFHHSSEIQKQQPLCSFPKKLPQQNPDFRKPRKWQSKPIAYLYVFQRISHAKCKSNFNC